MALRIETLIDQVAEAYASHSGHPAQVIITRRSYVGREKKWHVIVSWFDEYGHQQEVMMKRTGSLRDLLNRLLVAKRGSRAA